MGLREKQDFDYSQRAQWLRAVVLGGLEGLVFTTVLLMNMDVDIMATQETKAKLLLTGFLGLIAGALRIAASELVSVYTQVDTMTFQATRDLKSKISAARRSSSDHDHEVRTIWQVASPAQVAVTASLAYLLVGAVPLLAYGFVEDHSNYLRSSCSVVISASLSMVVVGVFAAVLGRASIAWSCARVLVGGLIAILIMWGKIKVLGLMLRL